MNADNVLWHPSVARQLPQTTQIVPRPVLARRLRRLSGERMLPPDEEECWDAIRVLEEAPTLPPSLDWFVAEAERVFAEASA